MNIKFIEYKDYSTDKLINGYTIQVDNIYIMDNIIAKRLNWDIEKYWEVLRNFGAIKLPTGMRFLKKEQAESAVVTLKLMK